MTFKRFITITAATVAAVSLAACGAGGGTNAQDQDGNTTVTVALPFPSCLAWWPFHAAQDQGFFEEEGIAATFEGLDGSAAAIQAALSGQADVAVGAPDNYLSAAAEGAPVTGWYSVYTSQTFFLVTPKDSGVTSPADLRSKTIGISTPGGGDVTYARSLLAMAGVAQGEYEELAVGDGGSAATALNRGAIDAYSASYFDEEIIKAGGIELTTLSDPSYPQVAGQVFVSTTQWTEQNSDTVDGIGRAVAKGTDWGLENPDQVLEMCSRLAPDETEDREFAQTIISRVGELVTPLDSANGQYGAVDEQAWTEYRDLLVELEIVPAEAGEVTIDNSHLDAWNSN